MPTHLRHVNNYAICQPTQVVTVEGVPKELTILEAVIRQTNRCLRLRVNPRIRIRVKSRIRLRDKPRIKAYGVESKSESNA